MLRRQLFPAQIADELVVDLGVGFHLDGGADELALSAHREFTVGMGQFYVTLLRVEVLEDQIAVALEFLALVILRKDRNVAVFYCPSVRRAVRPEVLGSSELLLLFSAKGSRVLTEDRSLK